MNQALLTFVLFTVFVGIYSWYKMRKEKFGSATSYFLGGRSLGAPLIAISMLLTNISTEQLVGMNGSSYKNGFIVMAWEVTSAIALVIGAVYFIPRYLKMGLTTIPQYLELRFDKSTHTIVNLLLIVSFVVTLLPVVLYTGALNFETLFDISKMFNITRDQSIWYLIVIIGVLGSVYATFGGLKAVAYSDAIYGIGLFIGGLMVPVFALMQIGHNDIGEGLSKVYTSAPEKFNSIGSSTSVLPFSTLFTGLVVNQIYFWCMNQVIVQRALGASNLKEAQKGFLIMGLFKILMPIIIVLPGVIGFYYFKDTLFANQDTVYPELVKKVLPISLVGFFAAVVMGTVLSTLNGVLNSAATLFSIGVYKRQIDPAANDKKLVRIGKMTSLTLAVCAMGLAPLVAKAPEGMYQLLQQLNGIFFIPIASILIGGFFIKSISAQGAKAAIFTGLAFYILTSFVFKVNLHFIHVWGIEFLLNIGVMLAVSAVYKNKNQYTPTYTGEVEITPWKYTKPVSIFLIIVTVLVFYLLS
ncbi:solute:sodium symporter family transporter [Flavihumibacter profundi]|uniref:solute:sodium symporter family transporter n=1 Tax=Flavihumibacter profundi TaxID=2716883 RepID=UPI001CC60B9D|nr:solute:sodium symporter family transporter [Flavihumibacter profundi]MBZ5858038.1 solute:sodium symporter family transporter [Flavihumibacter profundi]